MVKLEIKKSIVQRGKKVFKSGSKSMVCLLAIQRGLFEIYIILGADILRTLRIVYTKHSQ